MIKEIRLPLKDYTKYKNISKGMFAISELYLVSLPKFDSKKVFKCNIFFVRTDNFQPKRKYWVLLYRTNFLILKNIFL